MASGTVLLTGATGFVGVRILAMALQRGYRVRCAVRSPSGMDRIRETPSIKKLAPTNDQLSSVVVPEITLPNAYDQAVSGVQFIIHVASPIHVNSNDPESTSNEDFIRPAVNGTVGMLESAATYGVPLLKRVVLTSSIIAMIPHEYFLGIGDPQRRPFGPDARTTNIVGPFKSTFLAYQASKIASLNATEDWRKENTPPFDVVNIMPALIGGHNDLATTVEDLNKGGNAVRLSILKGVKAPFPIATPYVDVDDVALAHIRALDPRITGHQSFIVGRSEKWHEAGSIAKSRFPEAFEGGLMKEGGSQPEIEVTLDASKTREVLGIKPTSFEMSLDVLARQYIGLSRNER